MKDGKREGFVKDNEVPISVKLFRDLLLNMFREIFKDCKVVTVIDPTSSGEGRDNWVIRPNDSPSAGRIIPSLASEFPLRERCEKVGDIGGVSIVGITIKYATEDSIVFLRWKRNLSSWDGHSGIGYLIPTFSISWPGGRIIRVKIHDGERGTGHSLAVGTDLNGRKPKTSVEKNSNRQVKMEEATKGTDLNGREPLAAGGKWRMEKVGADLNGKGPTISKMVRNEKFNSRRRWKVKRWCGADERTQSRWALAK